MITSCIDHTRQETLYYPVMFWELLLANHKIHFYNLIPVQRNKNIASGDDTDS